jgi:L-ribulokinase
MTKKYAIGIDYGTQSGRAVLVDLADGTEVADHVVPYPHEVIDEQLPSSWSRIGRFSILRTT